MTKIPFSAVLFLILGLIGCGTSPLEDSAREDVTGTILDCRNTEPFAGHRNVAVIDRGRTTDQTIMYYYVDPENGEWTAKHVLTGRFSAAYPFAPELHTRVYWSPDDDLVLWSSTAIWMVNGWIVESALAPTFDDWSTRSIGMIAADPSDAIPEHVNWIARNHGQTLQKWAVMFDIKTGGVWSERFGPGYGNDAAWTKDDVYIRITDYFRDVRRLEVARAGDEDWVVFHPRALPEGTRLYLFRRNEVSGELEAIIGIPSSDGTRTVEIVRSGGASEVVTRGVFSDIVVSPDRTQLLGAIDQDGAFTRAAGEDHSGRQAFWLEYLEGRTGTEKFYLLGDGRYLLRKSIEEDGARIAILERGGDSVQEAYLICGPDGQVG